ncbi:MAG: hypothetical protein IPQ18_03675 [Saprospiraceae bacterium]|jgi:hypothetical protein|nr:hypothetical protein [Saprospiraceae bacterium]MBL0294130.1 hypothetical protein [Saprospiraceae bacterium]
MKFITEDTIESCYEYMAGQTKNLEPTVQKFAQEQPHILSYLVSEPFEVLTDMEQDFMLFVTLVIWRCVEKNHEDVPLIDGELISEMEEVNWSMLKEGSVGNFRERLDVFFQGYSQEDLLAFIEDSCTPDEGDNYVTPVGREPMFIALKTIVDSFDRAVKN